MVLRQLQPGLSLRHRQPSLLSLLEVASRPMASPASQLPSRPYQPSPFSQPSRSSLPSQSFLVYQLCPPSPPFLSSGLSRTSRTSRTSPASPIFQPSQLS